MSVESDAVLRGALALPLPERAEVAAELLASLDDRADEDPVAVTAAWRDELERRSRRALSGEDPGAPWPEVRDRVRTRLTR